MYQCCRALVVSNAVIDTVRWVVHGQQQAGHALPRTRARTAAETGQHQTPQHGGHPLLVVAGREPSKKFVSSEIVTHEIAMETEQAPQQRQGQQQPGQQQRDGCVEERNTGQAASADRVKQKQHHGEHLQANGGHQEGKSSQEGAVVARANAVPQPRTVVVEAAHAHVT